MTIRKPARIWLLSGALAVGAVLAAAGVAAAATGGSAAGTSGSAAETGSSGESGSAAAPDPAKVDHGPGEKPLTGTTADKVKAAALVAVPGGTVIRVETDSAGSPYEAHVTKSPSTPPAVMTMCG
jgi:hypothetical protein